MDPNWADVFIPCSVGVNAVQKNTPFFVVLAKNAGVGSEGT